LICQLILKVPGYTFPPSHSGPSFGGGINNLMISNG